LIKKRVEGWSLEESSHNSSMTEEEQLPQEASASNPDEEAEVQLGEQITELGNQIKEAKTAGQPKEEWDPLLKEMLRLKVCTSGTDTQ